MHILHYNQLDKTYITACRIEGPDLIYVTCSGKTDRIAYKAIHSIVAEDIEEPPTDSQLVWVLTLNTGESYVFGSFSALLSSVQVTWSHFSEDGKPAINFQSACRVQWDTGMSAVLTQVKVHADHL